MLRCSQFEFPLFVLDGLLSFFLLWFQCRWGTRANGLFINVAFYCWIMSNTNIHVDLAKSCRMGLYCCMWLPVLFLVMKQHRERSAVHSLSLIVCSVIQEVKGNRSFTCETNKKPLYVHFRCSSKNKTISENQRGIRLGFLLFTCFMPNSQFVQGTKILYEEHVPWKILLAFLFQLISLLHLFF